MSISIGVFYVLFALFYGVFLELWYYVLYPKHETTDLLRRISVVVGGTVIFLIILYGLARLLHWEGLLELLFPEIMLNGSVSWLPLLAGTAWICILCSIVHGIIFLVTESLSFAQLGQWVLTVNLISYLCTLALALILL